MTIPIGIDPASGKETCIWYNGSFRLTKAQNVRDEIVSIIQQEGDCLIAWDAPISFSEKSYSDRVVDKITRAWVKSWVDAYCFEKNSINALPFSGLSHWVISCKALGLPFGKIISGLQLFPDSSYSPKSGSHVIEVHPAVAMGCMWLDAKIEIPFPVYKKTKEARKVIVNELSFPEICSESDDILDAYVAFLMADMFIENKSGFVNNPENGSYVLPFGTSYEQIKAKIG